jgi:hypothetical protein
MATTASTKLSSKDPGGMIIVLNGFPGVGKLTILKEAKKLLPGKTRLVDNHVLIDAVAALHPERSTTHHNLRRLVRKPIFEEIRNMARDEGYVFLMLACLVEQSDNDTAFLDEYVDLVRGTSVPLFWINARCDEERIKERVGSPERCQSGKTKLTDVDTVIGLMHEHDLINPLERGYTDDGSVNLWVRNLDMNGSKEQTTASLLKMVGLEQSVETV